MLTAVAVACLAVLAAVGSRLERRRLDARRRRRAAEVRVALLETARSLPGSDVDAASRIACEGLRSLGFDASTVAVQRGAVMVPLHTDGIEVLDQPLPANDSFAGRCLAENRTIVVGDYAHEPTRRPERAHLRSIVLTPVRVDGRPVAALSGARRHVAEPSPEEVAIAETVAVHLGRAFATESAVAAQEDLLERMRRLDAMRSGFVGQISDELRDRLVVVRRLARSLAGGTADLPDARRTELLTELLRHADDLRATIDTLLDFSRFQAERPEPALVPVELRELLTPLRRTGAVAFDDAALTAFVRVDAAMVRHGLELLLAGHGEAPRLEVRAEESGIRLVLPTSGARSSAAERGLVRSLAQQLLLAGGARLEGDDEVEVHLAPWSGL